MSMSKPHSLIFFLLFISVIPFATSSPMAAHQQIREADEDADDSQPSGSGLSGSNIQFLLAHNAVRRTKSEQPLTWDYGLERYARWWAGQRRSDCQLIHSFSDGDFKLGENIFWGGGSAWSPSDAVSAWAGEARYYDYESNSCEEGQQCGHYTQIVWKDTRQIGCARVVCDDGDVFMTCNYYPPGNYVGERPY